MKDALTLTAAILAAIFAPPCGLFWTALIALGAGALTSFTLSQV